MFLNLDTNGMILLCAGLLIRYLIGRRRFNRKNFVGLQVFSSYLASRLIPILENIFNFLGLILICFGAVMMLI